MGPSPQPCYKWWNQSKQGQHPGVELCKSDEIERLLRSPSYVLGRCLLKACVPLYCFYRGSRKTLGNWRRRFLKRK